MYKLRDLVLVGAGAMILDFLFHLTETTPMEVPLYFVAKFLLAMIAAYAVVTYADFSARSVLEKAVIGGVLFDVLVGLYYALAYYTQSSVLSCCYLNAPAVNGVPQITYFMLAYYAITGNVLAFIIVHFLALFVSFYLVYKYVG